MDGVSRLQTRGWRKVGRVKGRKGIGFDVFNDDLIIIDVCSSLRRCLII